jgi:HPt (histidine-containing phosphotransfer) domain-containing protein/6-pyruvoyl-tetrahydropterin synthase
MADLNQSYDSAKSQINSIKSYKDISAAAKQLKSSAGNSFAQSSAKINSSLDNISNQQKRYLRDQPTSFDQLLELINITSSSGLSSTKYLKKKLLEVVVKIEPQIQKIISEEALKALGCSQEQTFNGYDKSNLKLNPLTTLPTGDGIYVPVQSLDIVNLLKKDIDSKLGKISYEKPDPEVQSGVFKPYSGPIPFPMNKEMNLRMENSNLNRSFYQEYGKNYQGTSGLDLFDFVYSPTNQYGVNQDCYRVALIDKPANELTISGVTAGQSLNKVGEFLQDYYSTIKLVDSVNVAETLVNVISGAISIKSNLSAQEIEQGTKFSLIIQRILGLCFDSRREIDVSGISKVAELDGVDDSFFDLTEVDLRNIDIRISNIQNGVMEFEGCDNIKLPVDYETLVNELDKFRDVADTQSLDEQVKSITNILDTIYQNPEWKAFLPTNFNLEVAINKEIVKQIPLAVASIVLSPKVLFPIFTLIQVLESQATNTYNQAITSGNTIVQSGNTTLGGVNNIINNSTDFLKVFKSFNIQVMSRIGAIFLKTLYEILKKDIITLVSSVISDVSKSQRLKKYAIILRLVNILLILAQLIDDFRKCKSLITDILLLLKTIFGKPDGSIPMPLLLLTQFLPGTSPERATINTLELLQSVGIPTGTLPDGSPNLMGVYNLMTHKGSDKEESENGKVEGTVIVPPLTGGILRIFAKKR